MTKQELLQHVIKALIQSKKSAEQSFAVTKQAAIEAPGAMQSHSDTTKSQMGNFAEKVQESIIEKDHAINTLQTMARSDLSSDLSNIRIGSVAEVLTETNERETYFMLPVGGGIKVTDGNRTISVITPRAPLAIALIGKKQGETIKLQVGSRQRKLTIISIQ